jgi:hypothetical protein
VIYLHTGCKFSEPWDFALQKTMNFWGLNYKICNLLDIKPTENDIFLGRLNESCLHLKQNYDQLTSVFSKKWPESLAVYLYDDKIAQIDFLKEYPTPKQFVIRKLSDISLPFPVVQKKSSGSSSKNVKLIHSLNEVEIPSVHQEFCINNDSDYRITVIGDFVVGMRRMNRDNDFRASGSNKIVVLKELPVEAVDIAWEICQKNNFITMAFDFLKLHDQWVIIEMSYTYRIDSILKYCDFYIDMRNNQRVNKKPDPASMILSKFFQIKYL